MNSPTSNRDRLLSEGVASIRRIAAIDMLRGVAVALMVFDHARFYFGDGAAMPIDAAHEQPALFFAHWIFRLCGPLFVLLAGLGAYLRLAVFESKGIVARYLIGRGLMLVALDVFIMPLVKWFDFDLQHLRAGPLWAIGWSLVVLGAVAHLRSGIVGLLGLLIVASHNALDGISADRLGPLAGLWVILHEGGSVHLGSWATLHIVWPVWPWLGLAACGFAVGELYRLPPDMRRTFLFATGMNLLVTFVILRTFNLYGDPMPWESQDTILRSVMSYFNCTRQPPSLCFLLVSLGPALILLGWLEGRRSGWLEKLAALGCVPLYCYVAHWLLLHAMAIGLALWRGQPTRWLFQTPDEPLGRGAIWAPANGVELAISLLLGAVAIVVLYISARRYAWLKFVRRPRWASYF